MLCLFKMIPFGYRTDLPYREIFYPPVYMANSKLILISFFLFNFTGKNPDDLKEKILKKFSRLNKELYKNDPYILITFENEVKMIRNCLIINVMFIQNDTLWV